MIATDQQPCHCPARREDRLKREGDVMLSRIGEPIVFVRACTGVARASEQAANLAESIQRYLEGGTDAQRERVASAEARVAELYAETKTWERDCSDLREQRREVCDRVDRLEADLAAATGMLALAMTWGREMAVRLGEYERWAAAYDENDTTAERDTLAAYLERALRELHIAEPVTARAIEADFRALLAERGAGK